MRILISIILYFLYLKPIGCKVLEKDALNKFKHILLIVKYNFNPTESQVLLYYKMWSRVFSHIHIVIPPYGHVSKLRSYLYNNTYSNVTVALSYGPRGFFAYRSVFEAMLSYPHYQGYLFAHDDMAMNVSKLIHMNLHIPAGNEYKPVSLEKSWNFRNNSWRHWNTYLPAMNNVIAN